MFWRKSSEKKAQRARRRIPIHARRIRWFYRRAGRSGVLLYMTTASLLSMLIAWALLPIGIKAALQMTEGPTLMTRSNGWLKLVAVILWAVVPILAWNDARLTANKRLKGSRLI